MSPHQTSSVALRVGSDVDREQSGVAGDGMVGCDVEVRVLGSMPKSTLPGGDMCIGCGVRKNIRSKKSQ